MTEPAPTPDDDIPDDGDFDFPAVTLAEVIAEVEEAIDYGVDELTEDDLEKLCAAIRKKIDDIDPGQPF
jgi:predicted RNase H-like HicB family nuclease